MAEWTRARTANATILQDALTPFAGRDGIIRLGGPLGQDASWPEGSVHAFYKYYVYVRSEEHTSELQSLMSISYAVFCLKKKKTKLKVIKKDTQECILKKKVNIQYL